MHKTIEEAEAFLSEFLPRTREVQATEIVVCPPYLALKAVVELCVQTRIGVAAQNMHEEPEGAFTGEVSAPMLREVGVDGVVLGHSERRTYFAETDEALARKVPVALEAGLRPLPCVGGTGPYRDAGAGRRGDRVHPLADLLAERRGCGVDPDPLRRLGDAGQRQ